MSNNSKAASLLYLSMRIIPAVILLQTLYFKFSGSDESVYIFTRLGVEPWGRYFAGVMELIAAALLVIPKTAWAGGSLSAGIMMGAILSHITILGIDVQNDGGLLFGLAAITLACSATVIYLSRKDNPILRNLQSYS